MMTRGTWIALSAAMVIGAAAMHAQDPVSPRVRGADPGARYLLSIGSAASPTIRSLLQRVEASDIILIVRVSPRAMPLAYCPYGGKVQFVSVAGGQRYVFLWLDADWGDSRDLVGLLGHELCHVTEIAEAPQVVGQAEMVSLFLRIGHRTSPHTFETDEAQDVEARVYAEFGDPRNTLSERPAPPLVLARAARAAGGPRGK